MATTGLVVAYVVSRLFRYDAGTAAGVIAGSLTESATIGTASDAIARLGLADADAVAMTNRIPVAFAVTYLIGVVGAAWFLAQLAPRIMGVDLAEECRQLRTADARRRAPIRSDGAAGTSSTARMPCNRSRPSSGAAVTISKHWPSDARLFVERIRRAGSNRSIRTDRRHRRWRHLAITGRREMLIERVDEQKFGVLEVDDRPLLEIPAEVLDVVVTHAEVDGRTLAELARDEAGAGRLSAADHARPARPSPSSPRRACSVGTSSRWSGRHGESSRPSAASGSPIARPTPPTWCSWRSASSAAR